MKRNSRLYPPPPKPLLLLKATLPKASPRSSRELAGSVRPLLQTLIHQSKLDCLAVARLDLANDSLEILFWEGPVLPLREGIEIKFSTSVTRQSLLDDIWEGEDFDNLGERPLISGFPAEGWIASPLLDYKGHLLGVLFGLTASSKLIKPALHRLMGEYATEISRHLQDDVKFHDPLIDPVTTLPSVDSFASTWSRMLGASLRHEYNVSLVVLDLDNFTSFAQTHSTATTDLYLYEVGRAITRVTRDTDPLARGEGDEFLLALPFCSSLEALRVAQRLQVALLKADFKGFPIPTFSAGVACNVSLPGPMVWEAAYEALRKSKVNGPGNCSTQFATILPDAILATLLN